MRKVLVTGAKGFLGKHLLDKLFDSEIDVISFEGDVSTDGAFNRYNNQSFDHVIHLAAKSFVPDSWKNPETFFKVNVCGVQNAVEFCRINKCSLTYISSYLYGNPRSLPISEQAALNPTNPYALTKYLGENICKFYAENFNIHITVVRPFNVYGPGQTESFLIPELIKKFLSDNSTISVLDLKPRRDYIFVKDLVDLIICSLANKKGYQVFNAGSGYSLSVKEVIDTITKITGINKEVISHGTERKNEILETISDNTLAESVLGWRPSKTFEEGLKETIEFYR